MAGLNTHCRTAATAAASSGATDFITFASCTRPSFPTSTCMITVPSTFAARPAMSAAHWTETAGEVGGRDSPVRRRRVGGAGPTEGEGPAPARWGRAQRGGGGAGRQGGLAEEAEVLREFRPGPARAWGFIP